MKLIAIIVNSDDAKGLVDNLLRAGHRATTISTTGGFLREGNATILVGTEDAKVSEILALVRRSCHTRTQYVNPLPPVMEPGELYVPNPVEVKIGGAIVFTLNVERFEKY